MQVDQYRIGVREAGRLSGKSQTTRDRGVRLSLGEANDPATPRRLGVGVGGGWRVEGWACARAQPTKPTSVRIQFGERSIFGTCTQCKYVCAHVVLSVDVRARLCFSAF